MFGGTQLEVDAERLAETLGVGQEPGGEVVSLVGPHFSRQHGFETTELHVIKVPLWAPQPFSTRSP